TLLTFGEILFGVIDHVICAKRSHKIGITRAANAGHIRAERLGYLHRECAHPSRRTVDQHPLTRLNLSFVADRLQRRNARYVDGRRLFKSDIRWFQRDCSMRTRTNVLGKGASLSTEYFISWFELRYILTDCFHRSRKVNAHSRVLWFAQADSH